MEIVCLDLEGVLVPEIWIAFAEETGIPELKRTTRDEPDYDKLMKYRLNILKEHGLGLKEIQETISKIDPLPGAKEFLQFANENGVQIYYVSDRAASQVDATIKNLEKEGIPVQGRDHLMFLEEGVKSKEGRRQKVQETTNLVMLFGDNLVDFADFSKNSSEERDKKLDELQKEFGEKFIIFPNPMYGSWESTVYKGEKLDAKGQVEEREKALESFDK